MTIESTTDFVKSTRTLAAHVTIKHSQLKNLLCRDSSSPHEDRILYCCRHSVRSLNPQTNHTSLISPKLSFEPRSIASAHGITVAGAETGTIGVMENYRKMEYDVGGSLVNGVHIYNSEDHSRRALISNNDCSLKIFNLETMQTESSITCPTAMNHASISPDGKMLAAVGDRTEVYLFAHESGRWRRYADVCVSEDACFSSVFSPSQRHLAVGSQDGSCAIFDLRMIANNVRDNFNGRTSVPYEKGTIPLHRAYAVRPYPHGSVRTVSWSPSPLDMLVFTESTSYATLLDCRNFALSQRLRISDPSQSATSTRECEISGAAWSKTGQYLYIGGEQSITEFNIRTGMRRQFPSYGVR